MVSKAQQQDTQYAIPATEIPPLSDGERYIGAFVTADPALRHHLILLPGDNADAGWKKQMEWAQSLGGDLPTKAEAMILFAVARNEFKRDTYWTNTPVAGDESYAWFQYFTSGDQYSYGKSAQLRARAVRRVPIQ